MCLMPVVIGQERDFGEFKWQSLDGNLVGQYVIVRDVRPLGRGIMI